MTVRERIERGFEAWGRLVARRRWWFLVGSLLMVLGWAVWIPGLRFDNSTESFLLKDDPASRLYREFRQQFGQDEHIMIGIAPPAVFDLLFLERLRAFHRALEVEVPHIQEVTSLLNARHTRGEADVLIVEELMAEWPRNEVDLREIERRATANPVHRNVVLSEDARLTTVTLEPVLYSELGSEPDLMAGFDTEETGTEPELLTLEEKAEIVAAVREVVSRFEAPEFLLYVVGEMVTSESITETMRRDVREYVGVSGLAIALLLLVLFRRPSGVLLPFVVVAAALPTTVGIQVCLGIPASSAMQLIPIIILTVGVCNAVHVLVITYQRLNAGAELENAIAYAFGHSGLAILMANLTTAAGMSSFMTAALTPITHLGIIACVGVLAVMFYSFGLLPALLAILPIRRGAPHPPRLSPLKRALLAAGDLATRRPRRVLVGTAGFVVLMAIGVGQLRFSHDILKWFPREHPVRVAVEYIDREMRGTNTLEVWIDARHENALHEPGRLKRIESAMAYAQGLERGDFFVGKALSLVDIVKETNQALNENRADHYRIPAQRELVAQELLLFENSGSDDLEKLTDSQFRQARITLRVPLLDGVLYPSLLAELDEGLRGILGDELPFVLTGRAPLMARGLSAMTTSLARSYLFALAVITPLMILLIGSLRVGLLSMIPNLLPIATVLGVMGLCGIPLDASNIIIGSVVIGLAVDDTIHFMHRFQWDYEESGEVREAVRRTLSTTGSALLFTSLTLTTGFLVMAGLGSMLNMLVFGLLTALGIVVAFIADVLVSPALLALVFSGTDHRADLLSRSTTAARF